MNIDFVKNDSEIYTVSELEKKLFSNYVNNWTFEQFKSINQNPQYIFKVLKIKKNIVGYIVFFKIEVAFIELHKIAISEKYQGMGLSKVFLSQLIKDLKTEKIENIILEVMNENYSAISLYKSLDFKDIGVRKNYYKIFLDSKNIILKDALILKKKL